MKTFGKFVVAVSIAGLSLLGVSNSTQATGGKIAPNLSDYEIVVGDDSTVTLRLEQPIICPVGSPTCEVTLVQSHGHSRYVV